MDAAAAAAAAAAQGQQSPGGEHQAGSPVQPGDPSNGGGEGASGGASTPGQNGSGGTPQYSDINQILDQILNITDQSLDEAQVLLFFFFLQRYFRFVSPILSFLL